SFTPVKAITVPGGKALGSLDPNVLNSSEEDALTGVGGKGCPIKLKVMRVDGGLVVMQSYDKDRKVTIEHDDSVDKQFPNERGLSVKQSEFIIANIGKGNAEQLAKEMSKSSCDFPTSPFQKSETDKFVDSIKRFIQNNKMKYFSDSKTRTVGDMPQTVLVETLNLLSDNLNRASASSPVGNSNHPYYSTDQFKDYTYPNIRVKSHDIGLVEGDFTHILFTPADAHERCKAASKMYEGGHIQAEIDFFHPKDHVPFQVGQVGVTDCNHKYWPLMYIVSPSENKDACKKIAVRIN
ncbi:hypothetical protein THAOC_30133, partial [Thalassiosira oceanica]